MIENFEVLVTKDTLVFSAAHFITFEGNRCEPIHGHNYRVKVEVAGPLDENDYVFDFIALRDLTQQITASLDHRVLLPTESQKILVQDVGSQVEARFEQKLWSFPREDCVLLPIRNTTAELLARWIGEELHRRLRETQRPVPRVTRVSVEENFGQWGRWEGILEESD